MSTQTRRNRGDIYTPREQSFETGGQVHLPRSSVSSIETGINTLLAKAWTSIDRLSDLTDKIKSSFFQAAVVSILLYGCSTWTQTKRMEKKLDSNYTRMLRAVLNKSWNSSCTATYHPSRKLSKLDEPDMQDTAGEIRKNSKATYSRGPLHTDEQRQNDLQEPTYNSSVSIQDITWKTRRDRWTIGTGSEKGSGRSGVLHIHQIPKAGALPWDGSKVIIRTLVEVVLPLCRDAVCVFYSSSTLGSVLMFSDNERTEDEVDTFNCLAAKGI